MLRLLRTASRPRLWLGLIGLLAFRFLRFFIDIKLGELSSDRVGHFFIDVAIRQSEHSLGVHSGTVVYSPRPSRPISNTFLLDYASRELNIRLFVGPLVEVASKLKNRGVWNPSWFLPSPRSISGSRDPNNVLSRAGFSIKFTDAENAVAHDWLSSVGWQEEQPIICLLVRDSQYLDSAPGLKPQGFGAGADFWDYHSYRNSNIETFVPAVEWLVAQGAFVLRMGKAMKTPIEVSGTFDYAFSPDRSDFLDVWLFANCSMCLTTGTGPDVISLHSGRTVVAVNYLPLGLPFIAGNVITAAKALYDYKGVRLSLTETIMASFVKTEEYSRNRILIRDLSAKEIMDIVKEGWLRFRGDWQDSDYDRSTRQRFEEALKKSPRGAPSEMFHPDARLSSEWMKVLDDEREGFEKMTSRVVV